MACEYYRLSNLPVLHVQLKGIATRADLREVEAELQRCLDKTQQPMHLLINLTEMTKLGIDLKQTKQAIGFTHPKIGRVVLFGGDLATRSLLTILARFTASDRLRYFGSEADAMAYLQKVIAENPAHAQH
jgi:hypothetical protein